MLPLALRPLTTTQNLLACEGSSSLELVVEKRAPLEKISRNGRLSPPAPVAEIRRERHHHTLVNPLSNQFPVSGVIIQILRLQSPPRRKDPHTGVSENEIAELESNPGVQRENPTNIKIVKITNILKSWPGRLGKK